VLILLAEVKIQFIDSCLLQNPKTVFLNNHARINIGVNRLFPNPAAQQPTGPHSDRNYASPFQSKSIDLHTPYSALAPSLSASPSKKRHSQAEHQKLKLPLPGLWLPMGRQREIGKRT
jgi:hypothetical protein